MDDVWLKFQGFKNTEHPSTVASTISQFFNGRVDMIAFDSSTMGEEFKNAGKDTNQVEKVMDLFQTPPYMAISLQTSDELLQKVENSYNELIKKGEIKLVN